MVQTCVAGKKMRDLNGRFLMFRTLHAGFKIFTGWQADAFAVKKKDITPNSSASRQLTVKARYRLPVSAKKSWRFHGCYRTFPHLAVSQHTPKDAAVNQRFYSVVDRLTARSAY